MSKKKKNQFKRINPKELKDNGAKYKKIEETFKNKLEDKAAICALLRSFSKEAHNLHQDQGKLQLINSKFKIIDTQDLNLFWTRFDNNFNITQWTSHTWILYTITLWESRYWDEFSNAIGVPKNQINSPIIRDLYEFRRNILKRPGENFKNFPNFKLIKAVPHDTKTALNPNKFDKIDWFGPESMIDFCNNFWIESKINPKKNSSSTSSSSKKLRSETTQSAQEILESITPEQASKITEIVEKFKSKVAKNYYDYLHLLVLYLGFLNAFENIKFQAMRTNGEKVNDTLLNFFKEITINSPDNKTIGKINLKSIVDDISLNKNSQTKGWFLLCLLAKAYSFWEEGSSSTRKEISEALQIDINKIRLPQIGEVRVVRNRLIHAGESKYTASQIEKIYKDLMEINPHDIKIVKEVSTPS